jgi:hypothetical protein
MGKAIKGSQYWIQEIINGKNVHVLDNAIGFGKVRWLSPLAKDYKEYQLSNNYIRSQLFDGYGDFTFWPSRQPQWDAIGIVEKKIILVEAKAYPKEAIGNKTKSKNEDNIKLIDKALTTARQDYLKLQKNQSPIMCWNDTYYQFANRLTFLHFLTDQNYDVVLVFLNVVNDASHKPVDMIEWKAAVASMYQNMLGTSNLNNLPTKYTGKIVTCYYDAATGLMIP